MEKKIIVCCLLKLTELCFKFFPIQTFAQCDVQSPCPEHFQVNFQKIELSRAFNQSSVLPGYLLKY